MTLILPFDSEQAVELANSGGKGANLARLAQAGFPVPPGFIVATQAYCDFVAANRLDGAIHAALSFSEPDAEQLETASAKIRALFAGGALPEALRQSLREAYRRLGGGPVAVRSSATAEDLPEMSFAGQQDTYLNILGEEALFAAVVNCWSSLWTARAVGYRMHNHVPQQSISLAVAVQAMVESQVSGVLFSANPLTGRRNQTVIDAAFGLGEALVSGQVEPDHYLMDSAAKQILEKTLGAKALSIHARDGGGTRRHEQSRKQEQALTDDQILALSDLGRRVADFYGQPQDIEWAWADGRFYLLQSRPVTSLFPAMHGLPAEPLRVTFSFGSVQGMLDPMTPIGRSAIKMIFATCAGIFGIRVDEKTQTILYDAGERLWVDITPLVRNTFGRKVTLYALEQVDPAVRQLVLPLFDEPGLQPGRPGIRPARLFQLGRFFVPTAGNVLLNILSPDRRRAYIVANGERILAQMKADAGAVSGSPTERMAQIARLFKGFLSRYLPSALSLFVSGVASGMVSLNFIRNLMKGLPSEPGGPNWDDALLELTRGIPYNPTTEMDLRLWDLAHAIQSDPQLLLEFTSFNAAALARRYRSGEMPPRGRELAAAFLDTYGGRGLGEIDLGRERWVEEPFHVFEVLASYLQITRPDLAPDAVFARGEQAAQATLERICAALRQTPHGGIKVRLARLAFGRMRRLMGLRESPKFFAVRLMGLVRAPFLQAGAELVEAGRLEQPDDVFYLSFSEIEAFAAGEPGDWRSLIAGRRAARDRELLRRQLPRLLLSDGRAFYDGILTSSDSGDHIAGSPVSPGRAEGLVRVVLDPRQANLRPGEILVCPGTDPSWTPLFLSAAGLVMEVGGMMTHGAVVAREYGIPAIVGVDRATTRLRTGCRIRIDGSTGMIELLESGE